MTLREYLKSIADAIRSKLNLADYEKINAQQFPEAFDWVYDRGHGDGYENGRIEGYNEGFGMGKEEGYNEGYHEGHSKGEEIGYGNGWNDGEASGIEIGKQAEYDAFWDAYQENGTRTYYALAFSGKAWVDSIFKPKHNIVVTGYADYLFSQTGITDIKGLLEAQGRVLDTSGATTLNMSFYSSSITHLPTIDCSGVNRSTGMQYLINGNANLVSVEKVIMPDPTLISNYNSFLSGCPKLETVVIEGVIGKGGIAVDASTKLSHDSIVSIINALSTTTSGLAITLSKTAVNNAFTGGVDGSEWQALIATKPKWTISLV